MKSLILLILFFAQFNSSFASGNLCSSYFGFENTVKAVNYWVTTKEGIVITGEDNYPLDLVMKNLRISSLQMSEWRRGFKNVVSIAEGMSPLVPHLRKKNINAKAMDIWYAQSIELPDNLVGRQMKRYRRKNAKHLIQGDAFKMPFEDNSISVLLSHKLINNLAPQDALRVLFEVISVVKPGGEARIFGA